MGKKTAAVIILLLTILSPILSQTLIEKEDWIIGYTEFSGDDIPQQFQYLLRSYPMLLMEELNACENHILLQEEKDAIIQEAMNAARRSVIAAIEENHEQRANLLFSPDEETAEYLELTAEIHELTESLADISESSYSVASEMAISVHETNIEAQVLPYPLELRIAADQHDVDYLIFGDFYAIQDYLYLEAHIYSTHTNQIIASYEDAFRSEEAYTSVSSAADAFADELLGTDWASMQLTVEPETTAIYINDQLKGVGTVNLSYIPAGNYTIRLIAQGYREELLQTEIESEQAFYREIQLEDIWDQDFFITSQPEGADVYIGSRHVGTTPLETSIPYSDTLLRIQKEGFLEASFHIGPNNTNNITALLVPDEVSPEDIYQEQRIEFYDSFGFFILSIPVTLGITGIYENLLASYNATTSQDDISSLQSMGSAFYYGQYVSIGVNIGLFINMTIQLFQYLESAIIHN
ncbi:MAG: PEGA domain-containing protein [Spirochaetia bacterium]